MSVLKPEILSGGTKKMIVRNDGNDLVIVDGKYLTTGATRETTLAEFNRVNELAGKKVLSVVKRLNNINDLSIVDGVGPVRAKQLNKAGIKTVEALAKTSKKTLAEKVDGLSEGQAQDIIQAAKSILAEIEEDKE